ncbi:hypothetical protein F5X99DRAFT_359670 [Biscogniauxia marginata]|nr:hypothetical protein F5X99DRAFT_359670 [Biscogniauxia marginata]
MTTVTAASGTTTLTPPSSSHGEQAGWKYAPSARHDHKNFADYEANGSLQGSFSQNGNPTFDPYAADSFSGTRESRSNSRATSFSEHKRLNHDIAIGESGDENSKWIHRDKLAKIENEELQAAGIKLPKPRAQSRPGRDRSRDKVNTRHRRDTDASEQSLPRPRKNSELVFDRAPDTEPSSWDLRRPEEIAEDPGEYWVSNETRKGSRIPVLKASPAPLASDHVDRDASGQRKQSSPRLDDDASTSLRQPRSRRGSTNALEDVPKVQAGKRSTRDVSPRKTGNRKTSTQPKSTTPGRPKTRSGPSTRSGSATRPTTRSGELSPKAPEGEPPWMISAYKPDPRLPPDQQLLPTVAKRLQQEKWEQEGKFGNIYDKDFRPLNEETFKKPPSPERPREPEEQQAQQEQQEKQDQREQQEQQDEWPLRQDAKGTTLGRSGTNSYTTMPKIQDKHSTNPMGSPRSTQNTEAQITQTIRIPEPPEETEGKPPKAGCGCCIVM